MSAEDWAKIALNVMPTRNVNDAQSKIKDNGYDIDSCVKEFTKILFRVL
jgi:hypothetical protein